MRNTHIEQVENEYMYTNTTMREDTNRGEHFRKWKKVKIKRRKVSCVYV